MATFKQQLESTKIVANANQCFIAKVDSKNETKLSDINRPLSDGEILWILKWYSNKFFRDNNTDVMPIFFEGKRILEVRKVEEETTEEIEKKEENKEEK